MVILVYIRYRGLRETTHGSSLLVHDVDCINVDSNSTITVFPFSVHETEPCETL